MRPPVYVYVPSFVNRTRTHTRAYVTITMACLHEISVVIILLRVVDFGCFRPIPLSDSGANSRGLGGAAAAPANVY